MPSEAKILAIKAELKRRALEKFPRDVSRQKRYIWGTINEIKQAGKKA